MGGQKKYIDMFGSFTEPFYCCQCYIATCIKNFI